jgi:hypothetical protein
MRETKRVRIKRDSDFAKAVERVRKDKKRRIIQRDGEPVAAIVSLDDLGVMSPVIPTAEQIASALAAAGSWKGHISRGFAARVDKVRHESPPSPPPRR